MIEHNGNFDSTERFPPTEARIVMNPALCAWLVWLTGMSFQAEKSEPMSIAHAFLVLPLLLHHRTIGAISSTQKASGLAMMVSKLKDEKEDLVAVHDRARAFRGLTAEAIGTGEAGRLLTVNPLNASLLALSEGARPRVPERLKLFAPGADKLGTWFARLPLAQVASLLRVDY